MEKIEKYEVVEKENKGFKNKLGNFISRMNHNYKLNQERKIHSMKAEVERINTQVELEEARAKLKAVKAVGNDMVKPVKYEDLI